MTIERLTEIRRTLDRLKRVGAIAGVDQAICELAAILEDVVNEIGPSSHAEAVGKMVDRRYYPTPE